MSETAETGTAVLQYEIGDTTGGDLTLCGGVSPPAGSFVVLPLVLPGGWLWAVGCFGRRGAGHGVRHHGAMAYDEDLADRIRALIAPQADVTEMRMFGGLAFLIGRNMSVGVSGQGGLMVRVEPDATDALLEDPHAEPFVMRGRPMRGWLRVGEEGLQTQEQLEPWVRRGVAYARSLPPKRR